MKPRRALTIQNVIDMKRDEIHLTGRWHKALGTPEVGSVMLVWGGSGQGKTRFSMELTKELTQFGKVAFNSLEMGASKALAHHFQDIGLKRNVVIFDRWSLKDMVERMTKKHAPKFLVIDSLQYLINEKGKPITQAEYIALREALAGKTLVLISHAEGREPAGRVAKSIRYDADMKVFVRGYKAFCTSRYGGGQPIIIWEEGATDYWGAENL